ncbi:MAG: ABC transporter ATP-binding protein [Bacillota bacterium]|nr:ABC transporter ATP-binding protein [Bacillota bacterium]
MNTEAKKAVVQARNLVQKSGKQPVINDIDLDLFQGECLGVFGLRGSGKTTLLHALAGIERCKSGSIDILGYRAGKSEKYKRKLGLVTQERSLFQDLNVAENLDFLASIKQASQPKIEEMIERFQLQPYLKDPVNNLDVGVYQRLALACALLNEPQVLIVDEMIRDINLDSRLIILKEMESFVTAGNSCICGFSNMEYVHYMDRVAWLDEGKIQIYSPEAAAARWNELVAQMPKKRGDIHV